MLDGDRDGKISSKHITLEELSTPALEALTPFLLDVEKENVELDQESFVAKMTGFINVSILVDSL